MNLLPESRRLLDEEEELKVEQVKAVLLDTPSFVQVVHEAIKGFVGWQMTSHNLIKLQHAVEDAIMAWQREMETNDSYSVSAAAFNSPSDGRNGCVSVGGPHRPPGYIYAWPMQVSW